MRTFPRKRPRRHSLRKTRMQLSHTCHRKQNTHASKHASTHATTRRSLCSIFCYSSHDQPKSSQHIHYTIIIHTLTPHPLAAKQRAHRLTNRFSSCRHKAHHWQLTWLAQVYSPSSLPLMGRRESIECVNLQQQLITTLWLKHTHPLSSV